MADLRGQAWRRAGVIHPQPKRFPKQPCDYYRQQALEARLSVQLHHR